MNHAHLYRTELTSLGYGRPVWEPDPGTLYDCIQIGDVGYFHNEKFVPLFNILPPNDSNRNRRLPFRQPDFPALHLPDNCPATDNTTPLKAGLHAVDSSLVFSVSGEISSAGSVLSGETSCSFANEKGAALILPFEALREDTLHDRLFKDHMLKNYRQWYNYALVDLQRDIKLDDLILISGCVLTRKWTTATYFRSNRAINATLGAQVAPVAEFKFSLSAGWRTSSAITTRPGPYRPPSLQDHEEIQNLSETLVNNQCVFLRGFCVKERFLGKTLKAAAGYHDPGTHGPQEEGAEGVLADEDIIVESLSVSAPDESLISVLLDYMLEESDADVVIANDSDLWPYLREEGNPKNLRDTLKRISPPIKVEDGVGSLVAEVVKLDLGLSSPKLLNQNEVSDQLHLKRGVDFQQMAINKMNVESQSSSDPSLEVKKTENESFENTIPLLEEAIQYQIPRLFALIIGINVYQMNYRTLRGAVTDGKAFKSYLMKRLYVPESHIITLFDRDATRSAIIEGFRKLRENGDINEGDPIFIFYAGLGSQKPAHPDWELEGRNTQMEVILPYDCGAVSEEHKERIEPIPNRTIEILIDEIAAQKGDNITVVFDCCYSASGTRREDDNPLTLIRSAKLEDVPFRNETDREIWDEAHLRRGLGSHVLISACSSSEEANEYDGHGKLSTALLKLLDNISPDKLRYCDILAKMEPIPLQNPQCQGYPKDRLLFDGKVVLPRNVYPIRFGKDTLTVPRLMTRRSYDNFVHDRRVSKSLETDVRMTDNDLFDYVLRVAVLAYLLVPKATELPKPPHAIEHEHSSLLSALSNFSIGDMFRDVRDSKSVKFPEKLLKVLEQKLQDIAMGKDSAYSDQLVRRTMGNFYGQFMVDSFKRQMKDNRKIEELILMFATHATSVLKKEATLAGDGWKLELNNQIAQFIKLLRECLRNVSHVSPELLGRLDTYTTKLAPAVNQGYLHSDSDYDSGSVRGDPVPQTSVAIADMSLVKIVVNLFKFPDQAVQAKVDKIKGSVVSKMAAITDLKICLNNMNIGAPFPGRREDFDSEAAWQNWRIIEASQLQQLMDIIVQFNPELAKSTPNDVIPIGHHFTFIPPNPKKFYKRLVEYCLTSDLELMLSPVGILSHAHIELINECALRWRIGHPYRATCFLDLVKQFYERNDLPMECILEALQSVTKVIQETELGLWPVQDVDYLADVYAALFNVFFSSLYHSMDSLPNLKPSDLQTFLPILDHIRESSLLSRFDIEAPMQDIKDRAHQVTGEWYETIMREKQSAAGVNKALPFLLMSDDIEKGAKGLDKRFPEPLLGKLDIVSLYVEIVIPRLMTDLQSSQKRLFESSMNGPTPDVPIQDIFALYRQTRLLLGMYNAFVPEGTLEFQITIFFEPYVRQWLVNTDDKTKNWVEAAISHDKFEAEGTEGHSSSIVDLFDSLRSPINFLQELEWEDDYQEGRFFTSLAKTISKAIEQYCRSVEVLFLNEMFPRPSDYLQPHKSFEWLEKARQLAITGEKRVEPFNFRPESCVKLNNIEAARKLLDKMYTQMEADKIVEVVRNAAPPVAEKKERDTFLFSVKVVIAEGLVPFDSSPSSKLDTFVTLSDEAGTRLAKTRTIYDNLSPRWDETFDLSVDKPLWLMVSVRDRALAGKRDIVGRAYLCLDPRRFSDFLAHELWMDLDTQGRILVRVSMEEEKDDIQFYFGRAFRSLKRAEADMLRIFIDKMSPFIQQCLSRNVVKTLIKSRDPGLDYNKALGGVTALYRYALGASSSEPQIPLPSGEKPRIRPEELTDLEIEQAIMPLFDYFDANLQTLNTYLRDTAKEMVMTRVWKEILVVIEGLLIPPLSDISSEMKPLSDKEVDIVFRWLKFLRDYFYANGEGPVSQEVLNSQKHRDVLSIRVYYDWHTDALMEECVRMMQQNLRSAPSIRKRAKSVYSQRNLGTIREWKKEKSREQETSSDQIIMRILRMRPRTQDFIDQQLQIMTAMQEQQAREAEERKAKRQQQVYRREAIPPLPTS